MGWTPEEVKALFCHAAKVRARAERTVQQIIERQQDPKLQSAQDPKRHPPRTATISTRPPIPEERQTDKVDG